MDDTAVVAGCDVGSTTGKALIMRDGEVLGYSIVPCAVRPETTAEISLAGALAEAGFSSREELAYIVGTGYGRVRIPFASENGSEITCHGLGAFHLDPAYRTLVDIGGLGCKGNNKSPQREGGGLAMKDKWAGRDGGGHLGMARALGEVRPERPGAAPRSGNPGPQSVA